MQVDTEAVVRRLRKRGHPSVPVVFRCPTELVEVAEALGVDRTDGVVAMLDLAADARSEMGKEWIEVGVLAHREGITEGQALARLAKMGLEKKGRR